MKKKLLSLLLLCISSLSVCSSEEASSPLETLYQLYNDHFGLNQESIRAGYYIDRVILQYAGLHPSSKAKGFLVVSIPDEAGVMGHQQKFDLSEEQKAVDYLRARVPERLLRS